MSQFPLARAAAIAALLGGVVVAPAFAAPIDPSTTSGPPNSTVSFDSNGNMIGMTPDTSENPVAASQQPGMARPRYAGQANNGQYGSGQYGNGEEQNSGMHHAAMSHGNAADMKEHVEERIKTLHAKLMITHDQESQWSDVAQAMRDSESNVSALIQQRRENASSMNAVDDLDSYQKIAQAHADGLKKVNVAFSSLYNSMSPAQKQNADNVFGRYEGGGKPHHMHHVSKKSAPSQSNQ